MTSPMHSPLQSPLQPVMRSPLEFRRRGGAFTPSDLPLLRWWDPKDPISRFQDAAASEAAATGDNVGRLSDKSGAGGHITQASTARPTLNADGTLSFNGNNNLASATDISGTGSVFIVIERVSGSAWASISDTSFSNKFAGVANSVDPDSITNSNSGTPGAYVDGIRIYNTLSGEARRSDIYASLETGRHILEIRSVEFALWSGFSLFGYPGFNFVGNVGEVIISRDLMPAQRARTLQYLAIKWGVTLALGDSPQVWSDSGRSKEIGKIVKASGFATVSYMTTATELNIISYNSLYDISPSYTYLGLVVDGVHQKVQVAGSGVRENSITLPAGNKQIRIIAGIAFNGLINASVLSLMANGVMTRTDTPHTSQILFYGDSIISGANADPVTTLGAAMLIRASNPSGVGLEAASQRELFNDCADATARDAFVAKIVEWGCTKFYMAIGTNDYGGANWSAANFGNAYAATLDALHAAIPSLVIYAQTPITSATETPNALGNTLGDYRGAIATAVSTRTSFVTLVNGEEMLTLGDLSDGLHPSTSGHALYAAAIKSVLGMP